MPTKKKMELEISNEDIALKGIEYANKKDTIKELESQCREYRKPLEKYIDESGITTSSGSRIAVVSHADVDVHLKKVLRVSSVLLPEAIDVLRKAGLEECIEDVPTVREDVLERLYHAGRVSDDVLKAVYKEKSSYAFTVEIKNRLIDEPE